MKNKIKDIILVLLSICIACLFFAFVQMKKEVSKLNLHIIEISGKTEFLEKENERGILTDNDFKRFIIYYFTGNIVEEESGEIASPTVY